MAALDADDRGRAVALASRAPADAIVRLAVLARAAGGSAVVARWAGSLRLSGRDAGRVGTLVDGVERVAAMAGTPSDAEVRRLAAAAGSHLDDVVALAAVVADPGGGPSGAVPAVLGGEVERLRVAGELDDLGPALDGERVMDLLGLGPGPEVGEAVAWLVELRIDEGRLTIDEVERRLLDRWGPGGS